MLAGLRPSEKFLFSVIILFILALGFQFLAAWVAGMIYGFGFTEILSLGNFDDPQYVAASKLIQILGSLGTFILPAFLLSYLFSGDIFSYYGFRYRSGAASLLLVLVMMVAVIPFINYLAEINMKMSFPVESVDRFLRSLEAEAEALMRAFTATQAPLGLMINLLMIGVIAAVGEELIFRGLLQRLLQEMIRNIHVAVLITAILFSAFHFQFYSFLPRFILGIILGYLMFYGRSIWYPIFAHFVNNALGVIYYYFYARGSADDMLEEIGTSTMLPVTAVISLVLFGFFFLIWILMVRRESLSHSHLPGRNGKH